jgi:DNA-binding transcriptional LysR family regulator
MPLPQDIPSLNWLRVFEAAARMENFARAGELLNLSTSAISQQIKALENHFDEKLFVRHARSVELTDAGHAFLPAVRQALRTVEESAASLFGEEKGNTLTLQATLVFANSWLAPRLPDFSRRHPQVQLHLSGAYRDQDFQRAGAELKILFGPVHRSWAQCDRLFDETVYPVATAEVAASLRHQLESDPARRRYRIGPDPANVFYRGYPDGDGNGCRRLRHRAGALAYYR